MRSSAFLVVLVGSLAAGMRRRRESSTASGQNGALAGTRAYEDSGAAVDLRRPASAPGRLRNGVNRLRVIASDICGNRGTLTETIRIANASLRAR